MMKGNGSFPDQNATLLFCIFYRFKISNSHTLVFPASLLSTVLLLKRIVMRFYITANKQLQGSENPGEQEDLLSPNHITRIHKSPNCGRITISSTQAPGESWVAA